VQRGRAVRNRHHKHTVVRSEAVQAYSEKSARCRESRGVAGEAAGSEQHTGEAVVAYIYMLAVAQHARTATVAARRE